jgi:hypothetical protein
MMTRELELSILAAPLQAIDRRALSQAWCSALRVGAERQRAAIWAPCESNDLAKVRAPARHIEPVSFGTKKSPRLARGGRAKAAKPGNEAAAVARRSVRAPLAARIERAFSAERAHPKRATFSLGRGDARVHVILQSNGEQMMLLALCAPELRLIVGRALLQARNALAARGIPLTLGVHGGRRCSSMPI